MTNVVFTSGGDVTLTSRGDGDVIVQVSASVDVELRARIAPSGRAFFEFTLPLAEVLDFVAAYEHHQRERK